MSTSSPSEKQGKPPKKGRRGRSPKKTMTKPKTRTKLADSNAYIEDSAGYDDNDFSDIITVCLEDPKNPKDPSTTTESKLHYHCTTCNRTLTAVGNRKHKVRLHLRSKYHRLRKRAAADDADMDLLRILANYNASQPDPTRRCLEIRGKDVLYCTFCEAALVSRKSSNVKRHLESASHLRSEELVTGYQPVDSTTFHMELVRWLVDCNLSVDRLTVMKPFLEKHFRRRILEPATLKKDFLPYVLGEVEKPPKGPAWIREKIQRNKQHLDQQQTKRRVEEEEFKVEEMEVKGDFQEANVQTIQVMLTEDSGAAGDGGHYEVEKVSEILFEAEDGAGGTSFYQLTRAAPEPLQAPSQAPSYSTLQSIVDRQVSFSSSTSSSSSYSEGILAHKKTVTKSS